MINKSIYPCNRGFRFDSHPSTPHCIKKHIYCILKFNSLELKIVKSAQDRSYFKFFSQQLKFYSSPIFFMGNLKTYRSFKILVHPSKSGLRKYELASKTLDDFS